MIFIDSNIPMYLVGKEHPHKNESVLILESLVARKEKLVTNVEVLQEILHRYSAIARRDLIQPAFDVITGVADQIFPITEDDVKMAKDILLAYQTLSARDALHAAFMKRCKIETIFSFDGGFDILPNLKRIHK